VILLIEWYVLHQVPRITLPIACVWALFWSLLIVLAAVLLWCCAARSQAVLFLLCITLNGMLSGDNLFVFMMLLQQMHLHRAHHRRAISDGMLAALPVRTLIVLCGAALLERFSVLLLVFGAVLFVLGARMLFEGDTTADLADLAGSQASQGSTRSASPIMRPMGQDHGTSEMQETPSEHWSLQLVRSLMPLRWDDDSDEGYLARDEAGRLCATRLLVVVVGVTTSDILFAMDSTPALVSVTTSPFILVLSLAFSLLGLRPLYFMLAAIAAHIGSMQQALGVVLLLIATKILLEGLGASVPLLSFVGILASWRVLSLLWFFYRKWHRQARAGDACDGTHEVESETGVGGSEGSNPPSREINV